MDKKVIGGIIAGVVLLSSFSTAYGFTSLHKANTTQIAVSAEKASIEKETLDYEKSKAQLDLERIQLDKDKAVFEQAKKDADAQTRAEYAKQQQQQQAQSSQQTQTGQPVKTQQPATNSGYEQLKAQKEQQINAIQGQVNSIESQLSFYDPTSQQYRDQLQKIINLLNQKKALIQSLMQLESQNGN
ncbi:hypothetical protein [Alicyclobacillus dauci]|uniref:Uncharacterized protein n=1 Tax=Alicyclobacillus dauci TaxID=1475485 RepID=A0ABY6YYZ6_9BACL|nr:hypothetical protein [Alicyclobacillus dauci]WAH35679.1 hypothetical protein NZD86_15540 [Alicyclobacillus dauci]